MERIRVNTMANFYIPQLDDKEKEKAIQRVLEMFFRMDDEVETYEDEEEVR